VELILGPRVSTKPQNVNELATRIRDARLELGLNQTEFASLAGVTPSTCCQWEMGIFTPKKALLKSISRVVPERHKAYFLEYQRPKRRSGDRGVSKMSAAERDLLEEVKVAFVRKLSGQPGPWLKRSNSVHVQVKNFAGLRFVSFSLNSPVNKGVVVYLDKDMSRASRTDVHASRLRSLDVDWASLLLPFAQRWDSLKLLFKRIEQTTPQ
jgi:DNA-binding XRE family transcriptional regulator